jgi:hypothetical protein
MHELKYLAKLALESSKLPMIKKEKSGNTGLVV